VLTLALAERWLANLGGSAGAFSATANCISNPVAHEGLRPCSPRPGAGFRIGAHGCFFRPMTDAKRTTCAHSEVGFLLEEVPRSGRFEALSRNWVRASSGFGLVQSWLTRAAVDVAGRRGVILLATTASGRARSATAFFAGPTRNRGLAKAVAAASRCSVMSGWRLLGQRERSGARRLGDGVLTNQRRGRKRGRGRPPRLIGTGVWEWLREPKKGSARNAERPKGLLLARRLPAAVIGDQRLGVVDLSVLPR
jgi:hypothetical protein